MNEKEKKTEIPRLLHNRLKDFIRALVVNKLKEYFFSLSSVPYDQNIYDGTYEEYRSYEVVASPTGLMCKLCGKISSKVNLKRHFMTHHACENTHYRCPSCNSTYMNKSSFQTHVYKKHPEYRGIKADNFVVKEV